MQSGIHFHLHSCVLSKQLSAMVVTFPMPQMLSAASGTKDKEVTARSGFPKLHLHVLRSKARRLGSHLPEITVAYLPADAIWWKMASAVLIVSLETVGRREVFRLDAKAGGLCLCLNLWLRLCSIQPRFLSVTTVPEKPSRTRVVLVWRQHQSPPTFVTPSTRVEFAKV